MGRILNVSHNRWNAKFLATLNLKPLPENVYETFQRKN